ncbi:MAG: hypothetical protein V2A53_04655 [bacterium]
MKTAISIPQDLFLTVNEMAQRLNISRSRFITSAIADYVAKQNNYNLFNSLNKAYSEVDTEEDNNLRRQSKRHYSRLLEEEKW